MPPGSVPWCCNGSISIRVEDLNQWQPVPWGTRAHQQLYAKGRNRIENTNGEVTAVNPVEWMDGISAGQRLFARALSKKSCRAPVPRA